MHVLCLLSTSSANLWWLKEHIWLISQGLINWSWQIEIQIDGSIIISYGAKVRVSERCKKLFCIEAFSLICYNTSWPSSLDQAMDSWADSLNIRILLGLIHVHNFLPKVNFNDFTENTHMNKIKHTPECS